jgi:hypothetical protein
MRTNDSFFHNAFHIVFALVLFISINTLYSCKENTPVSDDLQKDETQLIAGRVFGTWASPSKIITPNDVPSGIFGNMRLFFSVDEDGYPLKFIANNCPIIFDSEEATWSVSKIEGDDEAEITLQGVGPVDVFNIKVSSKTLIISFYMGWENTETLETGEGDFSVTLERK